MPDPQVERQRTQPPGPSRRDGPTPDGYKVYRANLIGSAAPIATIVTPAVSYTDTTVEADQWYRYHVKGYNDEGDGTKSRTRFIHTAE